MISNDWYYEPPADNARYTAAKCAVCSGAGEVVDEMASSDDTGIAWMECATCDGAGEVDILVQYDPLDYDER